MTLDFRSHTEHNNIKIFRLINSLEESIKKFFIFSPARVICCQFYEEK